MHTPAPCSQHLQIVDVFDIRAHMHMQCACNNAHNTLTWFGQTKIWRAVEFARGTHHSTVTTAVNTGLFHAMSNNVCLPVETHSY